MVFLNPVDPSFFNTTSGMDRCPFVVDTPVHTDIAGPEALVIIATAFCLVLRKVIAEKRLPSPMKYFVQC